MITRLRKWIMKVARKLHTTDRHTKGMISTLLTAFILAVLLVGAIIGTELSQRRINTTTMAFNNPLDGACAQSCQGQGYGSGECLGTMCVPPGEFTNTQFNCGVTNGVTTQCCCYQTATVTPTSNTCNTDCVTGGYTSGSCQNAIVTGGGLCSTGGTTINGNGGCGSQTCCCISTGVTATPTTAANSLQCSITMPSPPHMAGATYTMQGVVTGAANNFISYNWQVVQGTNNTIAYGTVTNPTGATATWTAPTNASLGTIGVVLLTVRDASNATTTCQLGVQVTTQSLTPTISPTAPLTPIATPATLCGQNCYQSGAGDDGYCSSTANTCPNGGSINSNFSCMTNRNACCCTYNTPTPTTSTQPTATATAVPPTITPAACNNGTCIPYYYCVNNQCVTGTPTPTNTGVPSKPPSPTCFNPKPPIWSPGVTRSGDTITVAWDNQLDGLKSKVEVCTNGGGTCQVIFDGTSPASNSVQKTITGISTKDIIVQMTSTNTFCGTTSDLTSQYLAANASIGVNIAPTIISSNGTPAWLIAGAAFIVVLIITVAIVAM